MADIPPLEPEDFLDLTGAERRARLLVQAMAAMNEEEAVMSLEGMEPAELDHAMFLLGKDTEKVFLAFRARQLLQGPISPFLEAADFTASSQVGTMHLSATC